MRPLRVSALLVVAGLASAGLVTFAADEPRQARFAVRGRWAGDRTIGYRIEPDQCPLETAVFADAVRSALAEWQATGCALFREAGIADEPPLLFAWRTGAHEEDCLPFGIDRSVAHAGPVGPWTFVHFDVEREWDAASLRAAALHEIGHVLGLDHSPDEEAAMYPEPRGSARLAASDLAAIDSLYGGGTGTDADLVVARGARRAVLRSVAPAAVTRWTLFDTDGDGDEEVVVWRTDAAGNGALWSYHFACGPLLERTVGPVYGVTTPGSTLVFARGAEDARFLVVTRPGEPPRTRAFDERGLLAAWEGDAPAGAAEHGREHRERRGDVDGDGALERVARR